MWYILYMNKDVIYIEPEDDITDIITKIEKSKEKIVALVPPKKAGILRSVVNIKLITKAGTASDKTVVLVTVDPSITKLAAAAKLPVTKDLQSAPVIPESDVDASDSDVDAEEADEDSEPTENAENTPEETENSADVDADEADEDTDDADEDSEPAQKPTKAEGKEKPKKEHGKFITWIKTHKKIAIPSGIGGVALIALLVWALVFAPAVTITVDIKTTSNNFSESVTFTPTLADENIDEGLFHYEDKKLETINEVNFEATGQKNVGQKASGDVVIYAYFKEKGSVVINSGTIFEINGLKYTSTESETLFWEGGLSNLRNCDNKENSSSLASSGCQVSGRVKISAAEPGARYNIAASNNGWDTTANIGVYSDKPITGGTDEMKTIVSAADVEKAKGEISAMNEAEMKNKLYETIDQNTLLIIDSSFTISTSDAIPTPGIGEEVGEGVKPTLKAVTTASVYVVDKTKVEQFITKKANLADDQRIYKMDNPFIENFSKVDTGIVTGKLKTAYASGPRVTENDVVEITKGKGLGVAQHDLRDIDGVTNVTIDTSYPWVMSVPGDANKITVKLEVKE